MNTRALTYTATWQYSHTGRDQENKCSKLEIENNTAWASSKLTVIKTYSHVQNDQTKVSEFIALATECDILDDENDHRSVAMSLEKSDHGFV